MKVTLLGCGGSVGVPTSTGDWGVCDPSEPRNRRRRPAILVETEARDGTPRTVLIDTPPELRDGLVQCGVRSIDAVLFTHAHADHMHGIDDIRSFARAARQRIPVFGEAKVIAEIHERFAYTIDEGTAGIYRTILTGHVFDGPFEAAGVPIVPYYQDHGFSASTGFRIGNFAYSIDVKRLPEAGFAALEGITHWVVDCQQIPPHLTHSHLAQTLAWIERLKPERAVLTHMGPELDYRDLARMLPPGVEPGYDGMVLAF